MAGFLPEQIMLYLDIGMLQMALIVVAVPRTVVKDFREQPFVSAWLFVFMVLFWPFTLLRVIEKMRRGRADTE